MFGSASKSPTKKKNRLSASSSVSSCSSKESSSSRSDNDDDENSCSSESYYDSQESMSSSSSSGYSVKSSNASKEPNRTNKNDTTVVSRDLSPSSRATTYDDDDDTTSIASRLPTPALLLFNTRKNRTARILALSESSCLSVLSGEDADDEFELHSGVYSPRSLQSTRTIRETITEQDIEHEQDECVELCLNPSVEMAAAPSSSSDQSTVTQQQRGKASATAPTAQQLEPNQDELPNNPPLIQEGTVPTSNTEQQNEQKVTDAKGDSSCRVVGELHKSSPKEEQEETLPKINLNHQNKDSMPDDLAPSVSMDMTDPLPDELPLQDLSTVAAVTDEQRTSTATTEKSNVVCAQETVDELQINNPVECRQNETPDDESNINAIPSFMNRDEIFHKTAAAAIQALLTPRVGGRGDDEKDAFLTRMDPSQTQMQVDASNTNGLGFAPTNNEHLLSPEMEQKLERLRNRMHDPTVTLKDLLLAIATPDDHSKMDLGYMVRRKNACGALKVMTNQPAKRIGICWTVGVLSALTSVLTNSTQDGVAITFADKRIRVEYEAARNRAIAVLVNLAIPKENRMPMFHANGLLQALLLIIMDDKGGARRGCTSILAYLAKSQENRLLMTQIPGFFDALVPILRPLPPRVEHRSITSFNSAKKIYSWDKGSYGTSSVVDMASRDKQSRSEDDSDRTPKVTASQSPIELSGYDETADKELRATRQNVFALLSHLGKEKDNAYRLARDSSLLRTIVQIVDFEESQAHTCAVKFLANLSRHRLNTKLMVFQERTVIMALVRATYSPIEETRLFACYALQNLTHDQSCRQELASVDGLVTTLCCRCRYADAEDERLAAISALKNLCDEPANLIPLTNTPECIATLMHLAHGREDGVTEMMQYCACDALATLSHWLRKIATSGKALDDVQRGIPPESETSLFVPTLRVVTWNQWH
jgi:hypothetical protein